MCRLTVGALVRHRTTATDRSVGHARYDVNGYLTITGRLKEIIIRGGQNISPVEVEEVVASHQAVADCAVVGVEHEFLGEVPVTFVVIHPLAVVDATMLLDYCRPLLSAYKLPRAIHIVFGIPRTGSSKAMRFKLKQLLPAA